jgi:hypothetical protein
MTTVYTLHSLQLLIYMIQCQFIYNLNFFIFFYFFLIFCIEYLFLIIYKFLSAARGEYYKQFIKLTWPNMSLILIGCSMLILTFDCISVKRVNIKITQMGFNNTHQEQETESPQIICHFLSYIAGWKYMHMSLPLYPTQGIVIDKTKRGGHFYLYFNIT